MTAILAAIAWYGGLIGTSRGGFVEAMLLRLERGTPNSAAANTKQCPLDHPEHLHPALNSVCSASHSTSSCIKLGGSLPASRYIRTKTQPVGDGAEAPSDQRAAYIEELLQPFARLSRERRTRAGSGPFCMKKTWPLAAPIGGDVEPIVAARPYSHGDRTA